VSRSRTRLAAGVAAWLAALCAALAVGLSAVGAIGSGLLGPGPEPLTPAEVDSRLAAADTADAAGPAASSGPVAAGTGASAPDDVPATGPAAGPAGEPTVLATAGGTVLARCTGGRPEVVSATPAQGFRVQTEDDDSGPRVRFRAGGTRIEVRLTCVNDLPTASVATDD